MTPVPEVFEWPVVEISRHPATILSLSSMQDPTDANVTDI
jgi:hypothetical protein